MLIPDLLFAVNTSRHDSTGYTPAYLNFGRELEPPKALYRLIRPEPEGTKSLEEPRLSDIGEHSNRLKQLQDIYELVRFNLGRAFTTQSRHYNLRRRKWRCHVGDQVYRREHPLSSAVRGFAAKLAPKYSGPYTVVKVISPVVYDLTSGTGKILRRIHIKDLKTAGVKHDGADPDQSHDPTVL